VGALVERLSPEWWRDRLLGRLATRSAHASELTSYYQGTYAAPVVSARYSAAYRNLIGLARTPWGRLIVDTISERLEMTGIRTGSDLADRVIWDALRASYIDADQRAVHAEALITGTGYVSVWRTSSGAVRVTPESSLEVIHESSPGDPRMVEAALKVYPDDLAGVWRCEVYLPDAVYRYVGGDPSAPEDYGIAGQRLDTGSFEPDPDAPVEANPYGVVPVTPFVNRARVGTPAFSELDDLIPVLRRIDKITLDMLSASDAAGFRQKWATGLEIPRHPDTGQPIEPFDAAVSKIWISESPDTRFGSFDSTDLGPYMKVVSDSVAALAAISRVPAHYLMTDLVNPPSADSLVASESGLVAKVEDRQATFGQSWERVARLVMDSLPDLAGAPASLPEIIWASPERRSPATVADALVKLQGIGVPEEALWTEWGATPSQIADWRVMRATEALRDSILPPGSPEAGESPAEGDTEAPA